MKPSCFSRIVLGLVFGSLIFGCSGSQEAHTPVEFCSATELYGVELTPESQPREVAEVVIAAVQNDDIDVLVKLVAAKKVSADVEKITEGNQAFRISVDHAPQMTAQVVADRINQLTPDSRTIGEESIQGNQASVIVMGISSGEVRQTVLHFTRENELWRLVPSHRGNSSH